MALFLLASFPSISMMVHTFDSSILSCLPPIKLILGFHICSNNLEQKILLHISCYERNCILPSQVDGLGRSFLSCFCGEIYS